MMERDESRHHVGREPSGPMLSESVPHPGSARRHDRDEFFARYLLEIGGEGGRRLPATQGLRL
jgi:hypothetical protein